MIYKVYPVVLGTLCFVFWAAGLFATALIGRMWTLFLWPIPVGLLSWFLAGFVVVRFPRAAYVNKAEVDGFGYVHQPLDVLMPFWVMSFIVAALAGMLIGSPRSPAPSRIDGLVDGLSEADRRDFQHLLFPGTSNKLTEFAGRIAGDDREIQGIKFCWCPPGEFTMGSPAGEPERRPGEDQVEVTLTRGFWMAKYEATQGQWERVMGKFPGELTAELPSGDDYPVGNVNFAEVEAYCRKLTERAHRAGALPKDWEFRLPTEAQWEYACRAGTTTATSFGDRLSSKQANFKGKPYNGGEPGPSLGRAAKVGSYPANAWGLHDMHGNIYEWCRDWYHGRLPGGKDPDLYGAKATAQPSGNGALSRSRRGGCWADEGWPLRSAFRLRFEPERKYDHIGFRVVAIRL